MYDNVSVGLKNLYFEMQICEMDEERVHVVKSLITCDLTRPPTRWIRDYALIEPLGSGAFGQVYRARKQTPTQRFYAVKEINITQAMFGHTVQERDQSLGRILNEVNIIRHQMRHPNIVRYYKTFIHDEKLYIVMEMLEGLSLTDLIISMKDKQEYFEESRVWHIFTQLIVALRYLHREKCILHRDLSSNNIMVDEGDKVTITDFGLARQKQWDSSKMLSTVGTLVYSCPEIVQNIPYGEGVDVWALGCVLYQICTYNPPFQAECILTVASRIVKGEYVPVSVVSPGRYSEQIDKVISVCLTPDPTNRPDVVGVASYLTDTLLVELNTTRVTAAQAKRRLQELRDHFDPSISLLSTERISSSRATSADQLAYRKRHDQLQSPKHISSIDRTELGSYFAKKHPTIQISQTKLRPLEDPILALVTVVQRLERLHQTPVVRDKHHQVLRQLIDR
ncbi:Kinase domain protein [Fasciolopsis buskii]|uniref:Kinase domain protein n=1 Tax=Fasciolopsis buskii TaxID=27845 RepID=A0A8E0VIY7_9TREM|nr:Kinase domain protein [Fasciolopsis buski]